MYIIFKNLGDVPDQESRNDDDLADRLCYRYASILCVVFAVISSTSNYVGEPISCWVPAHFTGSQVDYTNSYCWVKSTYYLDFEEYIPYEHEHDKRNMVSYYQWVPLVLLFQALLLYLPIVVWRSMNNKSGINVNAIIETSEELQKGIDKESEKITLEKISSQAKRYFDNIARYNRILNEYDNSSDYSLNKSCCFGMRTKSGNYLSFLYIFSKIIFLSTIGFQIFLMDRILGSNYHLYGYEVLEAWLTSKDWRMPERFPRSTMCDLKIRRLGNVQRYTVQCVLSVNLFNEMIFLIVWWMLVILAAYTLYSFVWWLVTLLMPQEDERFIQKHLMYRKRKPKDGNVTQFITKKLRRDGVFVLRLIGLNTDSVTVTDIVVALYDKYYPKPKSNNESIASTSGENG